MRFCYPTPGPFVRLRHVELRRFVPVERHTQRRFEQGLHHAEGVVALLLLRRADGDTQVVVFSAHGAVQHRAGRGRRKRSSDADTSVLTRHGLYFTMQSTSQHGVAENRPRGFS